jgi:diguanylate cyclase (GGDEF)-like protein
MATSTTRNDDATNRQLWLLVGPVVVGALGAIGWSLAHLAAPSTDLLPALLVAALVAVANLLHINVRVGATQIGFAPTSAAVLVGIMLVDTAWLVLAVAVGLLIAKLIVRQQNVPVKLSFNVAKDTTAGAIASVIATEVGVRPMLDAGPEQPMPLLLGGLFAAALAYAIAEEIISDLVLARATRTSVRQRFFMHLDAKLLSRAASLLVALTTVYAYKVDPWLVLVVPPSVYAIHLASATRVRSRLERQAWQRLAQATDEFNVVDLEAVLRAAVHRAAEQFSADEIEVELHLPNTTPRVVRGNAAEITFDGQPGDEPAGPRHIIRTALASYQGGPILGELRLLFRGQVRLSEREQYTLKTFAAALCTAVRNATTFAETQRLADSHARAAAHDPLTGLANRRKLHEYGAQVLTEPGVSALLLLDLNHFKEVNDTLGHAAGDRLLVEVAQRLANAVQDGDLVARLGGDEFAVLFANLPAPAAAMSRAQTVLAALGPPMDLDGMRIGIEASGGVATAPSNGGVDELLRRADVAMYHAKRDGQRLAQYARARDTADVGALTLGGDLARAVAEREFTVSFQPIVDLGTGEAIAAEALARWHHPDRGALAPDRFLDAIERSGQLPAFAEVVLDQALASASEWADAGFPLAVAVNVSPRSLLDPKFPEVVANRLSMRDIPPDGLIIELTESVTLSQLEVVDEVLRSLRELGVRLALDDFGTGFSSLATLARVPVYELKIDRSFVATMDASAANAVIRSTIELGRSLDLVVVAEGVEREDQRRALWELGCPAGQGHLFARPMPAHRLLAALRRGCGGRPGTLAPPLHEGGAVIRMPVSRRRGTVHRLAE